MKKQNITAKITANVTKKVVDTSRGYISFWGFFQTKLPEKLQENNK